MSASQANGKSQKRNKLTKLRDVESGDRNPETAGKSALSLEVKVKDKEKKVKAAPSGRDAKVESAPAAAPAGGSGSSAGSSSVGASVAGVGGQRDVDGDDLMSEADQIALDEKLALEMAETERKAAELQAKRTEQKQALERLTERRRRDALKKQSPEQSVRFVPAVDVSRVKGADLWKFMADPSITVYGCKLTPMVDMFEVIYIDKHKTDTLLSNVRDAQAQTSSSVSRDLTFASKVLAATQALMQSDSVIATVSVPVMATPSPAGPTPLALPSPALGPLAAPKGSDAPKAGTRELKDKGDKRKRDSDAATQLKVDRRSRSRNPPTMGSESRPIEVDQGEAGPKVSQPTSPQSPSSRLFAKQVHRYERGD